ncbi:hypothetical protein GQ457_12G013030 [Hibiscus cannabinus]
MVDGSLADSQLSSHCSVFGLFNFHDYLFQVCIHLIGSIPAAYDKCPIAWAFCLALHLGNLYMVVNIFVDTYGIFNFLIPGPSFYAAIESSSDGNPSAYIPTHTIQNSPSSALFSGNIWRNLSSWMPQRETSAQSAQDDLLGEVELLVLFKVLLSIQIQTYKIDFWIIIGPLQSQVNDVVAADAGGSQLASEEQIQKLA